LLVSDVLDRINFGLSDSDDLNNKSADATFTNKSIVAQLKNALDIYASTTKGIEGTFSTPFESDNRLVTAPTDAIRSQAYRFAYVWRGGQKYPLNFKDLNMVNTEFPYGSYSGIPRFFNVWNKEISIFPDNDTNPKTVTLNGSISDTDTTINVDNTDSFPQLNGRFTINNEKIRYTKKTSTSFTGCERGIEGTTAASHNDTDTVTENNFVLQYRRKHFVITVDENDNISQEQLDKEMEIPDEHVEPITDLVVYKLLIKIDAERAANYKIDASAFYQQAKVDIEQGYSDVVGGSNITGSYEWERDGVGFEF